MDNPGEQELAELLGQARSMADAVRGAFRPPPEVAEASDESGAVTVTVAGGRRVTRVMVAADWKDRLGAGQLGMAVMQAVLSVQLGPVKDFFSGLASADRRAAQPPLAGAGPGPGPGAAPGPGAERPQPGPAVVADLAAKLSWDDLGAMLETVHKALDAVAAIGPHGNQDRPWSGRGCGKDHRAQ